MLVPSHQTVLAGWNNKSQCRGPPFDVHLITFSLSCGIKVGSQQHQGQIPFIFSLYFDLPFVSVILFRGGGGQNKSRQMIHTKLQGCSHSLDLTVYSLSFTLTHKSNAESGSLCFGSAVLKLAVSGGGRSCWHAWKKCFHVQQDTERAASNQFSRRCSLSVHAHWQFCF